MIASHRQEFRQAGEPDTVTRDELKADDWYLAGIAVEYRNHGPHDESPGPWRAYGDAATDRPASRHLLIGKQRHSRSTS